MPAFLERSGGKISFMSTCGALIGLLLCIVLIIRKASPVYSMIIGALVGGLIGGLGLTTTVTSMVFGIQALVPAIIRILTAGVLSGILIRTGAAASISQTIVRRLGVKHVFFSLAFSTMLLTAIGVFVDVAVITVAPVALTIANRHSISRLKLLLAMIGGAKCGNIISPNPNTLIAAENFNAPLSSVMAANVVSALIGFVITVWVIVRLFPDKYSSKIEVEDSGSNESNEDLPPFWASMTAPVVTVLLLALRPLVDITIDPLIALPLGGFAGMVAMRRWSVLGDSLEYGLGKMSSVAILLVGTGTMAGIIKASDLNSDLLALLGSWHISDFMIAPVSGILMSAATASTTAGATIASSSFSTAILNSGLSGVWGAAMVNASATVLDHLPHGSFFHATGGCVEVPIAQRLRLILYETCVGLTLTVSSIGCCKLWIWLM
jgi:GntP family gluconate:H+ symporter